VLSSRGDLVRAGSGPLAVRGDPGAGRPRIRILQGARGAVPRHEPLCRA